MADGKIKISELDEALQLSDNAEFPYTQDNGGVPTTFKAPANQIARKVAEGSTFTNLETTNKTLVGAINQTLNNFAEEYDTTQTYNSGDPVLYAGVLYKCNSNNVTGAWDSTKWDEAKAVEFGGGGGGSGGHTILDDEGTSLTQRDDLQFKGAYSEDDSTNDKTVVNVARTMTLEEFEQLTDDEKAGFINVADETSGSDDKFQPIIYSEEEREIGVWTDGKPLYEKTLNLNVTNTGDRFDISNLHIDTMIQLVGFIHQTGGNNPSVPYSSSSNDYGLPYYNFSDDSIHVIFAGSYNQTVWVVTIRYTKTTDQAGSGQWTPQGVPACHYSEDEQVIGTWIDGSTVYEKTLVMPNAVTVTANGAWIGSGVLKPSGSNVVRAEIVNDYIVGVIGIYVSSTNELYLSNIPKTADITIPANTPITIRYTKSST